MKGSGREGSRGGKGVGCVVGREGKRGGGGVGKGREGCCCHHVLPSGELVTQFWIN